MDIYKLKWTNLQQEIFRLLAIYSGREFNLRGIARLLKVSPTAVSKATLQLGKERMVTVEKSKTMNLVSVKFNRDNEKAINLKRVENLNLLYESGIVEFLHSEFPGCTGILFGSYSRGEDVFFDDFDDRNSDIDIAVIGTKGKEIDLSKFEKYLKREIVLNFYGFWEDIHKNLKNNILNGMVLFGGVEL